MERKSIPDTCTTEGCDEPWETGEHTGQHQTQANAVGLIPIIVVLAVVGLAFGVIVLVSSVMLGLRLKRRQGE
ncbi:MAG: hypothetical protein V3U52_01160 [Thermoplasmata archaeon]